MPLDHVNPAAKAGAAQRATARFGTRHRARRGNNRHPSARASGVFVSVAALPTLTEVVVRSDKGRRDHGHQQETSCHRFARGLRSVRGQQRQDVQPDRHRHGHRDGRWTVNDRDRRRLERLPKQRPRNPPSQNYKPHTVDLSPILPWPLVARALLPAAPALMPARSLIYAHTTETRDSPPLP